MCVCVWDHYPSTVGCKWERKTLPSEHGTEISIKSGRVEGERKREWKKGEKVLFYLTFVQLGKPVKEQILIYNDGLETVG